MICYLCGRDVVSDEESHTEEGVETHKSCFDLNYLLADESMYGRHGGFLDYILMAWHKADTKNKGLMQPLMRSLVEKYKWPSDLVKIWYERLHNVPPADQ